MDNKKSICLVMIVRDEEDTIERCIRSVAPHISHWIIVDTGSKDNTKQIILDLMEELSIEGKLYEREWVNFEVNRTESLKLAKNICDYSWIIDADDYFILNDEIDGENNPFLILNEDKDSYQILYQLNNIQYYRTQIVKSNQDWVYKGVLHEYLYLDKDNVTSGQLKNSFIKANISPLKRASSVEEKYAKDAEILKKALEKEPDNTRYWFYLAQSYRDSNQIDKAIEAYEIRVKKGGWEEEIYYSLYMIARLKESRGDNKIEVFNSYSIAWEYRPQRLEALFHVMRKLREEGRYILSFTYGLAGLRTSPSNDILFIEKEVWEWKFIDEFSLSAYYTGNIDLSIKYLNSVINNKKIWNYIPDKDKERLSNNFELFKKNKK